MSAPTVFLSVATIDARKAIAFHEQALVIDREIGDRRGEDTALWNSALAHDSLGNRPEAIEDPNAAKVRAKLAAWREG